MMPEYTFGELAVAHFVGYVLGVIAEKLRAMKEE